MLAGVGSFGILRWLSPAPLPQLDPIRELDAVPDDPALNRMVDAVDFENTTVGNALISFAKSQSLQLQLPSPENLLDEPANLHLKHLTVRRVLDHLLTNCENVSLEWLDLDGVIVVGKPTTLGNVVTRIYDIRPLLAEAERISDRFPDRLIVGWEPHSIFASPVPGTVTPDTESEKAARLMELLTRTVAPDTWQVNGGAGDLQYFNGKLVARNHVSVQLQLERLLNLLLHDR